jgi:hypothetical protein
MMGGGRCKAATAPACTDSRIVSTRWEALWKSGHDSGAASAFRCALGRLIRVQQTER